MEIKNIILYILIILVIYLIYKTRKSENFGSSTIKADVIAEVNNKYKTDLDTMILLADISKKILDERENLIIPAKLTKTSDAYINGTLGVANLATFYNNIDILSKNNSLLEIFPSYMIIMWPKETPPKGWAICDGGRYKLNEVGIAYVTRDLPQISTDGKQTIIVLQTPDLGGRCVVGAGHEPGSGANIKKIGDKGGQERVELTIANLPSHTHEINMWRSGNDDCGNGNVFDCGNGGSKSGVSIYNAGGGSYNTGNKTGPHNNMQPWHALNFIMKF